MERAVLEIPGYYYDSEKKKYFKIQPSSTAPSSSAYSSQDVKRRKARDHMAGAREVGLARQKGRIQRSKIMDRPLTGGLLEREHSRLQGGVDTARIFASGLVPQGSLSSLMQFLSCSDPLFDIDHRTDLGDSMVDVRIVFDDQLFTIRINADKHTRSTEHGSIEICHDFTLPTVNNAIWQLERFGHPGTSTSLTSHRESRRLAMTWLSGSPQSGIAITPMAGIPIDRDFDRPTILLGPGVTRGPDVSIYSSTPAPPISSNLFAFGASHGIFTVDKRDFDTNWISPIPATSTNHPKDIFALEFLKDNPSILLSGGRSGILNITDLRIPMYGRDSDTITHPSSITHIKQLDAHRLIVAGLNSSLCQYDLRFRKKDAPQTSSAPPSRKRPKLKSFRNILPTRSILSYPEYHNTASIQLGFDVEFESGVVAAAQEADEGHTRVQLFSLHGGHKLESLVSRDVGFGDEDNRLRNVKFVKWARDVEGRMKSLYVGTSPDIQRFAWGNREDDDS